MFTRVPNQIRKLPRPFSSYLAINLMIEGVCTTGTTGLERLKGGSSERPPPPVLSSKAGTIEDPMKNSVFPRDKQHLSKEMFCQHR
jgi:hypothetical protein